MIERFKFVTSHPLTWLALFAGSALIMMSGCQQPKPRPHPDRLEGMLIGSLIGDAAGGPVEFVPVERFAEPGIPFRYWRRGEALPQGSLDAYAAELELMPYTTFRPTPEPYAHWRNQAPPGTLTDDTRHKIIMIDAIHRSRAFAQRPVDQQQAETALAEAYIRFVEQYQQTDLASIAEESLREYLYASRWVLGDRNAQTALPPERLWGGLPTCAGQMALFPIAGLHTGNPERAYQAAFATAFIDNGEGRDLNAALVAGLAEAMKTHNHSPDQAWNQIKQAMLESDPYRFNQIPWVERPIRVWLRYAEQAADRSAGEPAELRRIIEEELPREQWWDAHVTLVMAFAAMELAEYHPIASMRLAIELGRDTDSTAQIVGAFMGALHGPEIFNPAHRDLVRHALDHDYGQSIEEWTLVLDRHAASDQ